MGTGQSQTRRGQERPDHRRLSEQSFACKVHRPGKEETHQPGRPDRPRLESPPCRRRRQLKNVRNVNLKCHQEPISMSLYDRLGGVYAIAAVVDDFIDRVMTDPRLNSNPKVDEAHHKVSRAGFKYLVTEQVCAAAGGPQRYTGRSMYDSHAHLDITEPEWQVFLEDLKQTFDRF